MTTKTKKKRNPKRLPVCTKKDLRTRKSKRRKCRVVVAKKKPVSPTGPIAAPPVTTPVSDAFPTPPAAAPTDGLRTYPGLFGLDEATRLLFRAGFGPSPGQAAELAGVGLRESVRRLMNPGPATLAGPAPTGAYLVGGRFAPADRYGHIALSFLDRAVRSTDSLTERMTLVLHDWFGVGIQAADPRYVVDHLELLRTNWRGSFRQLLLKVTQDPAMLQFLNGTSNRKGAPNENYGRELMELFGLGADRGAYTENDVREMARAFTGFTNDYSAALGSHNFRFDPNRYDGGLKTVFAGTAWERSGPLSWQDGVNAVVDHPLHPSFVVLKLWSYFIPTAPSAQTQGQLEALYRRSGEQLGPLVEAILLHPDLHQGPTMAKPPVVYTAGILRSRAWGVATDAWVYRMNDAGQMVGDPPNVSGWNDRAWLNTSTHTARWGIAFEALNAARATPASYTGRTESSADALESALRFWNYPRLTTDQLHAVQRVSQETWTVGMAGDTYGSLPNFLAQRQNVLRQLVAAAPDFQTC